MPQREYFTLMGEGNSFVEDRKSKFIGRAKHVESEAEAAGYIESIRKAEKGAAHNVYAYCLGRDFSVQRSNDDGEPSGTSGRPCLEAISTKGLTDCVVVVTRYFGGTLLGTGGLVRAYGKAAKEAVEDAGIGTIMTYSRFSAKVGYGDWNRLEGYLAGKGLNGLSVSYAEEVGFSFSVLKLRADDLMKELVDFSSGKLELHLEGEEESLVRI